MGGLEKKADIEEAAELQIIPETAKVQKDEIKSLQKEEVKSPQKQEVKST